MALAVPKIQVLSKNNYKDQHIVSLPNAYPLPTLAPSSIRIKSTLLSLTKNNISYAMLGHLVGWWDFHLLPPSIPARYSDPKEFGRISAWGYAEVIESNVSDINVGTQFYGYLPIGTLPLDMEVELNPNVPGQFFEVSKRREKLMALYNRYIFNPKSPKEAGEKESLGWDALMLILFQTGYLLNRFILAWEPSELTHPFGDSKDSWTFQRGALDDNSIVFVFVASSRTALGLAYCLKHDRPAGKKPRKVIGVGSAGSKAFTEGTGLYDEVLTYDADSGDLGHELGLEPDTKIVVTDFGARDDAADRWAAKLRKNHNDVVQIQVAGEAKNDPPEESTKKFLSQGKVDGYKTRFSADIVRIEAMDIVGEKKYYDDFAKLWGAFKKEGSVKGMRLVWGKGMEDLGKGWERLYNGEVGPNEGLLFSL